MAVTQKDQKRLPPYIAFKTFETFLDSLKGTMPGRIDRGVMKSMSGTAQSQILHALRHFDLVSAHGIPSDQLHKLANTNEENRASVLRELLKEHYPYLFDTSFNISNATAAQINEKFTALGATGNTVRLCISFFIGAAEAASLTVSPYIKEKAKKPRAVNLPNKRTTAARGDSKETDTKTSSQEALSEKEKLMLAKFPDFDPNWPDETQQKWFDTFNKIMGKG